MSFFEFVMENPDKPWNWYWLSANPNITMEIVAANPDAPWDWSWLSANPNITWEIVKANPDKPWNYSRLSWNRFDFDLQLKRKRIIGRTKSIKEELMAKTWNPETVLGRYLVEQEAEL